MWIGHSLGSVISYNILSKYKIKNIKEIITVGSPLGMKVIKRNLESPLLNPHAHYQDGTMHLIKKMQFHCSL